jgi:hypothetical protein
MKRKYTNTEAETTANFFTGVEVEHSPAQGMLTLFVTGTQPVEKISELVAESYSDKTKHIKHIYCGANQSFAPTTHEDWDAWEQMLMPLLQEGYWVTLDYDVTYAEEIHENGWHEFDKFIPMISVKLPYIKLNNYNTTIKFDDKGFEATNPGVWCHRLHDLMDKDTFTNWDAYKDDKIV